MSVQLHTGFKHIRRCLALIWVNRQPVLSGEGYIVHDVLGGEEPNSSSWLTPDFEQRQTSLPMSELGQNRSFGGTTKKVRSWG